jgi:hypothetical protein
VVCCHLHSQRKLAMLGFVSICRPSRPSWCIIDFNSICVTLLIDLHWVRALAVPMHLGLTDGPFVPHNLISVQESPVPLPEFQMDPRFKILMSSGSKEKTQITILFSQKIPASESPPGFTTGPLWGEIPAYRTFLHIS